MERCKCMTTIKEISIDYWDLVNSQLIKNDGNWELVKSQFREMYENENNIRNSGKESYKVKKR